MIDWLLRDRTTGRIVITQPPNAAMKVSMGAGSVGRVADRRGWPSRPFDLLAVAALTWWAVDETVRGVNPFRRMLGAGTLVLVVRRMRSTR